VHTRNVFIRTLATLFFAALCYGAADATVSVNKAYAVGGVSVTSINVGEAAVVTVNIQNSDTATPVSITSIADDISTMGGTTVLDTAPGSYGNTAGAACTGGVVTVAGSVATLTGGTIPQAMSSLVPGECSFFFTVYGNKVGLGQNTIQSAQIIASAPNSGSITQPLQIVGVTPGVTKVTPSQTVLLNNPQNMTFRITNPATNVDLTNTGFTINANSGQVAQITGFSSTCAGLSTATVFPVSLNNSTVPIAFTGGDVPASGTCTVTLISNATANAVVNTTFPSGSITNDQGVTNTAAPSIQMTYTNGAPNMLKSFNPTYIQPTGNLPNDVSQLKITLQNVLSGTALTTAGVTDDLTAAGLVIYGTPNASDTCGGTLTAAAGTATIQLSGATIPANSTCTILVNVTGTVVSAHTNTIPAANFTSDQVTSAAGPATAVLNVTNTGGGIAMSKTANGVGNTSAGVNTPVLIALTFTSLAGGTFTGGTFSDTLPTVPVVMQAYVDLTHQPSSTNCGPLPAIVISNGAASVTGSNLAIPTGNGTCTVAFYVSFPNTTGFVRSVTNSATGANFTGSSGAVGAGPATAVINELPTLTVQNYVSSSIGLINQTQTAAAEILDPSGTTDTNWTAVFPLNAGKVQLAPNPNFTFTGCPAGLSAANITIGANRESFTVGQAPGTIPSISATCVIGYTIIDEGGATGTFTPGTPTYTSTLTGNTAVNGTGTNSATFSTSNINVSKVFVPTNQIHAGATATTTIGLTVNGVFGGTTPTQANGVTLTDTLPANLFFAPSPNVNFTGCQQTGQPAPSYAIVAAPAAITFSNISLLTTGALPTTCTIDFDVTSSVLGNPANSIGAGSITSTSGITNASGVTASLTVLAGVELTKSFYPSASFAIGSTTYVRFEITNTESTSVLTDGSLTDNMPAQLTLASLTLGPAQPGETSCQGNITGTVGASTFVVNNLHVPAYVAPSPGQCVVYVPVQAATTAAPGAVSNTIGGAPGSGLLFPIEHLQNINSATSSTTLTPAPNLTLAKAFAPATIAVGGTSTLTITLNNTAAGAAPLSGIAFTDAMLPSNVTVAATPNASTTCGAGVVTAVAGANKVSLAGGSVGANVSCTVTVSVTSATAGIWIDSIPASRVTTVQGATNSNVATATLNVGNTSGVGIGKSFAPVNIPPNGTSVLTITLSNTGSSAVALSAVDVSDALPANITVASTPNASTTCAGGMVTAAAGATSVALAGAALAANASCTIAVSVAGSIVNTYTNTIPAGALTSAQGATNGAPASAQLTIGQPTLVVVKSSNPSGSSVSPGETIAYTVAISNTGTQALTNAHIADTLTNATLVPGSVTLNGASAADAIVSGGATFGSIPVGATDTIIYDAVVNLGAATGSLVTNTAQALGDQPCSGGSCTGTAAPNSVAPPILTAAKLIDGQQSESVVAGQTVTYTIAVANTGPSPAIGATLTDTLPAGVTANLGSVTLNGAGVAGATLSGQLLTVPLASVAAGTTSTVAFKATIAATAGAAANTASVSARGILSAVQSNVAMAHQVPPVIAVTKTAAQRVASVGDRVDFAITVASPNGVVYGGTTIVDTLPSYEAFASGTARVNGKPQEPTVHGHVLTWTEAGLTTPITITYATVILPGAPANGSLTNTVNVAAVAPGGGGYGRGSASAAVRIIGSNLGSCYPITGRVYLDAKGSGHFQDPDLGVPGVHIYIDDGENVATDAYGRYDFPCVPPGMHALRLDATTLPMGLILYDDRNIDSEKSSRRLVHHIYDTMIIEDINFAVTGRPVTPIANPEAGRTTGH
jgi:uncharacterized repeat protein (TIGR01451 family)